MKLVSNDNVIKTEERFPFFPTLDYPVHHGWVSNRDLYCYPYVILVTITITITYRNHYPTKYTPYQQYLYNRIKSFRDGFVTPKPWFEIRKILTSEGLKSPLGKKLGNHHVLSIYQKGKIREKRLKSQIKVTKTLEVTEFKGDQVTIL